MKGRNIRINRIPVAIAAIAMVCLLLYFANFYRGDRPTMMYGMLHNQDTLNMRKLLIASIQAALHGGLEIVGVAHSRNLNEKSKGKTDEVANDPFTNADGRSHCAMKHGLHRIFPRLTIVSEEDKHGCSDKVNTFDLDPTVLHEKANIPDISVNAKDVTVWIDPLDATQEFTERLYDYVTTMVCVAVKGQPVIGVIHSPFSGQTVWAWVGRSMSEYLSNINQQKISVTHMIAKPIITVSRSHAGDVKELTKSVFGADSDILIAAGAGYKVLQVVAKNATAYLHSTKIKKWDICAGDAILRSVGGALTTLNGEIIEYGPEGSPVNTHGVLATTSNHEQYLEKIIAFRGKKSESIR